MTALPGEGSARVEAARALGSRLNAAPAVRAERWQRCADAGIHRLALGTEWGGSGQPLGVVARCLEALGEACTDNGLLFALGAQLWACQTPIEQFGTAEQKAAYLPRLCEGSLLAAHAMTEPGAGSDTGAVATTAEDRGSTFVVNGRKSYVTNGPDAGLLIVYARTGSTAAPRNLSVFLIERDTVGVRIGPPQSKMGLSTTQISQLHLEDCVIDATALLGRMGAGASVFQASMCWERAFICAPFVGTMQRLLRRCVEHARRRRQFGKRLIELSTVADRLADMRARVACSRLLLYDIADRNQWRRPAPADAALVKLVISEALVSCSLDAMRIFGGSGYMSETGVEEECRDALAALAYSGTSDIQRLIIARGLDDDAAVPR